MGIDVPDLDDRTFEELLEDVRKALPVHADEWTDYNSHDPGITVLETLAWVAESDVYRLDRVTDAHREKYLQLLGVTPAPPRPATATVAFDPAGEHGTEIPAGTALRGRPGTERARAFETTAHLVLNDATLERVVTDHRGGRTDNTTANERDDVSFYAFGETAEPGDAMYLGFDRDPFDGAPRLDLTVDFHDESLPDPADHGVVPRAPGPLDCGRALPDATDATGSAGRSGAAGPTAPRGPGAPDHGDPVFEPSVRVVWEHPLDLDDWYEPGAWAAVEGVDDGTNHFYGGGRVSIPAPDGWRGASGTLLGVDGDRYWLRARIADPAGERRASGPAVPDGMGVCEDAVDRPTDRPGAADRHEVPPRLDGIRPNAVTARHCRTVEGETLTREGGGEETTARPDQAFAFEHAPVHRPVIEVGGERWARVPDFDGSGPDDRHYVLDAEAGRVRFGDEVGGEVPAPGREVRAVRYVAGGGTDGNLPASATWTLVDGDVPNVDVRPLGPATGGTDAESVDDALARLQRDRRTPYRAVTREDCRYLATHTPGLRFGRAAVTVAGEAHADCPDRRALEVVVVPYSTRRRPEPTAGFLEAVACHLERHRLLTDRVEVVPPTYVGVGVEVEVDLTEGAAAASRVRAVESALDAFLDPLAGFEGDGWPFGRPVYRSELYEAVAAVSGVDCVHEVSVTVRGDAERDGDGNVVVGDAALCYPLDHDVTVRRERDRCASGRGC